MNAMREVKVGLLGGGHICQYHVNALSRVPGAKIVAVYDLDRKKSNAMARLVGLSRPEQSIDDVLDQTDVVHVLTPPGSHAELTLRALSRGCHVFVEKPLAETAAECRRIANAAKNAGLTVGVDHSLLLDPFTVTARQWIDAGRIGRVLRVHCIRSQAMPEYEGGDSPPYYRSGGDPFRDLGIHAIYQIQSLLGDIRDAKWTFRHVGDDPLIPWDTWQVDLQCARGSGQIALSWATRPLQDVVLIEGLCGSIRIDRFGMNVTCKQAGRLPEHAQRLVNATRESCSVAMQVPINVARVAARRLRQYHGLQEMVAEFYRDLREGKSPRVDATMAEQPVYWVEKIARDADQEFRDRVAETETRRVGARILVTGATGLVGRALVTRLLADGERVRIVVRRPGENPWPSEQVECVVGDLGDPPMAFRAIEGMETVFHVAGAVSGSDVNFRRCNVVATRNVVDGCLKHGIRQLVYVSSLSVLKTAGVRGQIDESSALEPLAEKRGGYTQSKLEAECIVSDAARCRQLPAVILRPAEIVSEETTRLSAGVGFRKGRNVIVLGGGRVAVPLIDLRDVVDAMIACRARSIVDGSIVHLVDRHVLTQNELIKRHVAQTGSSLRVLRVPRPVVFAIGALADLVAAATGRRLPLSCYRLRSALGRRTFISRQADALLGVCPEGLRPGAPSCAAGRETPALPADSTHPVLVGERES